MNPRIKDFIGAVAVVAIVVFAYIAWVGVDAYSKSIEPSSFRSFAVSAEGKEVAVPDIAQFTFSVITQGGTDLEALQTENVNKANEAIDYLKSQGVQDQDITTQGYNVTPRYQTFNCAPRPFPVDQGAGVSGAEPGMAIAPNVEACPPSEIAGYTITQTVQVKVRDLGKAGSLLSGVVDNGANNVSQLFFTFDDRTAVESAARAKAIEQAKRKAEAVAEAGGFRVGRLLSIQESGIPYYLEYDRAFAQESGIGAATPSGAPAPQVEPGSQDITVNVTLVYEIR